MAYKFDSIIVNSKEADALKEMIFNRVRERSQSMNEELQTEVMDMARNSFVSSKNPFSSIVDNANQKSEEKMVQKQESKVQTEVQEKVNDGLGFPQRESNRGITLQSKIINEQTANAAITSNMQEARVGLSNKKSFMGALEFLNSQAAISLIRTRADKFEVVV